MNDIASRHCAACAPGTPPLGEAQIAELLASVPGWSVVEGELERTFSFKNYYQTLAFVNAVAWVVHREDHHPDTEFGYKTCKIRFSTHSVGGLTMNDFICAAKINELV